MEALEYRRLLPRYRAWLRSHPPKKATLFAKITHLFAKKPKIEIPSTPIYYVPKDILRMIVRYLPLQAQCNWRIVSRYWHQYVDINTAYWKNRERQLIKKEFPSVIQNIFGGADQIHALPLFHEGEYELMERFSGHRPFRFGFHMNFLKKDGLKEALSRGISPDGYYFIALVVRNVTLNNAIIMTIHETQSGWTISVAPWNYDYFAPFSGDICIKKDNFENVYDSDFEDLMKLLVQGKRIRRSIGSLVQMPCEFVLTHPKDVPNWNW